MNEICHGERVEPKTAIKVLFDMQLVAQPDLPLTHETPLIVPTTTSADP